MVLFSRSVGLIGICFREPEIDGWNINIWVPSLVNDIHFWGPHDKSTPLMLSSRFMASHFLEPEIKDLSMSGMAGVGDRERIIHTDFILDSILQYF